MDFGGGGRDWRYGDKTGSVGGLRDMCDGVQKFDTARLELSSEVLGKLYVSWV